MYLQVGNCPNQIMKEDLLSQMWLIITKKGKNLVADVIQQLVDQKIRRETNVRSFKCILTLI